MRSYVFLLTTIICCAAPPPWQPPQQPSSTPPRAGLPRASVPTDARRAAMLKEIARQVCFLEGAVVNRLGRDYFAGATAAQIRKEYIEQNPAAAKPGFREEVERSLTDLETKKYASAANYAAYRYVRCLAKENLEAEPIQAEACYVETDVDQVIREYFRSGTSAEKALSEVTKTYGRGDEARKQELATSVETIYALLRSPRAEFPSYCIAHFRECLDRQPSAGER